MATLTGKITDVTSKTPENITSITVKAPSARIGGGTDVIVSSPATVDFNRDTGDITISGLTGGLSWLYIEGDGWSDSIALAVADGMTTLVEAVANALGAPGIADYIRLLADLEGQIEDVAQDAVDAAAENIKWDRGIVPADTNSISELNDGSWTVGSASLATTLGLPGSSIGRLVKTSVLGGITAHWTPALPNSGGIPEAYVASTNAYGVWGEWVTTVAPNSTQIEPGTDWTTLIEPGFYHRRTTQEDLNAPTNAPGSLLVSQSYHSNGSAVGQLYMAYAGFGIYYRGLSTKGVPARWTRLDTREIDSPRRDVVVSAGLARRGHVVGTGGLGAVAFRFDHHLQQFGDKVLPLLKQYRIPWSQAINPGNIGQGNDTMNFETLTAHVHDSGGEIWNHGLTHSNFTTEAEADTELGSSLSALRDAMPSVWIDSFAAYGSGSMMGLGGWDEPGKFWNTYGGRILLAQHAFVSGLYSGQVRPLGGAELIGAPYAPVDTLSVSRFKSRLNGARGSRGGITFMLHPNRLDESGYLTLAQFEEMLAYAAAERDAGRIRILSTAGRSMADVSAPDRTLLENAGAGSVNVSKIRSVSTFANAATRGVPHELEVWVKADGDVTLDISIGSPTNPVNISETFSLNGAAKRLSLVATPPLDATTQSVTITGTCTHTQIKYRPI